MHLVKDYVSDLREEFSGYNGKKLSKDLMSGITVAAVALPLALAFGVSSGATAAAGLMHPNPAFCVPAQCFSSQRCMPPHLYIRRPAAR